jgi:NAD+ synthase (glutamine-hydrolysing)
MPHLRIALAQLNATVGDISANSDLVTEWAVKAHEGGAHLALFPEMVLTGYPVEDLALRQSFVEASRQSIERLAVRLAERGAGDLVAVVGYLSRTDDLSHPKGGHPQNVAAVLHQGHVVTTYAKHHLPNYGVFDEYRYFKPGDQLEVVRVRGVDVAIAICEDLWQDRWPPRPRRVPVCWSSRTPARTSGTRTIRVVPWCPAGPVKPAARWPTST